MVLIPKRVSQVISAKGFDPELRAHITSWHEQPFIDFLAANEAKIAKKLKHARTHDDQRDIGLELFVGRAFSIVGCNVTYEPNKKGPDFLIEYRQDQFFLETKRIRENLLEGVSTHSWNMIPVEFRKLIHVLSQGFLQFRLGKPNFLYIRSNRTKVMQSDLDVAFSILYKKAQEDDGGFFRSEGYKTPQDFVERARYCNEVILDHFWPDPHGAYQPAKFQNDSPAVEVSDGVLAIVHKAISTPFTVPAGSVA